MARRGIARLTERSIKAEMLYTLDALFLSQWWSPFYFVSDSDQPDGETHAWLGGVPGMKERTGNPVYDTLMVNEFFIKNVPFELGFRCRKEHWDFQKSAQLRQRVAQSNAVALAHPGELLQTLLTNAESTACYDGQYFFDVDHSTGDSGTQSNDLTYSSSDPSAPTVSEMADAIMNAIVAIWKFKDDKGNEMNMSARNFTVAAPPDVFKAVLKAIDAKLLAEGGTNIVAEGKRFTLNPQIMPRWSGNKIGVFRADELASPFILQMLSDVEPIILGRDSEYCKEHGYLLFKQEGIYNAGYGQWQHGCLVTFQGA